MDIQTLIEKRANRWQEAKTFLDERTDKDGKISAEDAATYERMESEIVALSKNIERFERRTARDLELAAPTTKPILESPRKAGRESDEYKQAVLNAFRTGFKYVSNALQESVDTSGGYLVPTEWDSRLVQVLEEENVIRKLGTKIQTSGEHKYKPSEIKKSQAFLPGTN